MNKEKRRFSRVNFQTEATIESGTITIVGNVVDLSLKGVFIETQEKLPTGQGVDLKLEIDTGEKKLSVTVHGRVVRVTGEGLGVDFESIDIDSFAILKEIIAFNLGDRDKVSQEFMKYISTKITDTN